MAGGYTKPAPRANTAGVTAFWTEIRKLGISNDRVFEIAGVTTFRGFSEEQLQEVLVRCQAEAGAP
jgi:hypothetical protein